MGSDNNEKLASWPTQLKPRPRTGVLSWFPPNPPNLCTVGECEGDKPTDSKQQDLQDTGQQQDAQEEHQEEPIIGGETETRGFEADQLLMVINTCKLR